MSPRAGERADHADVGEVARAEQQARLAALERRQALLQAAVDRHRPRHQPRGARADAPAHRRLGRRLAHARMVGEAEVVVRAQQQHGPAVEQHVRALRAADQPQPPPEAEALELVQALPSISLIAPPRLADRDRVGGAVRVAAGPVRLARKRSCVEGSHRRTPRSTRRPASGTVEQRRRRTSGVSPLSQPGAVVRAAGWRRCRAGARRSGRAPRTSPGPARARCRASSGSCPSSRR